MTLLDVYMLTCLPLRGNEPLIVEDDCLNTEEAWVVSLLLEGNKRAYAHSQPIPSSRVAYFRHRFLNDINTRIAALLAVWLDHYVFLSGFCDPKRGISR